MRVSETINGITTQYLVDENNPTGYAQVVEELRNGAIQTRYSYGRDLISQTSVGAGATSFYSYDGLGSVRALTSSAGSVTDRYSYDAFGSAIATSGNGTANAYRFTGEQQDAALGMYYLRARYYQPGNGRFWTRDSWALDQQNPREWNRYAYVAADPVNGVDPSGQTLTLQWGLPIRATMAVIIPMAQITTLMTANVLITVVYIEYLQSKQKQQRPDNQTQMIHNAIQSAGRRLLRGCRIDPHEFGDWLEMEFKPDNGYGRGDHLKWHELVDAVIEFANSGGCS